MGAMNPFVRPHSENVRDFNFKANYKRQTAKGLAILKGISIEEAQAFIDEEMSSKEFIEAHPEPTCKANIKQKNGDRAVKEGPFLKYLEAIDKRKLGMSPTLAAYYNPKQVTSFIAEDIVEQMAMRKKEKKLALTAKQKGDKMASAIHGAMQNAIKIGINSYSGSNLDANNPLTCRSTHSTLTSCCRITTATCTAAAERFLAGKRYYYKPSVIFEDLLFLLDVVEYEPVKTVCDKYQLHLPTPEETMGIITRSANFYFFDPDKLTEIEEFVTKCDGYQRAIFAYTYDFYHLAKFNDDFARRMVNRLTDINPVTEREPLGNPFATLTGDQVILCCNLLQEDLAGMSIYDVANSVKEGDVTHQGLWERFCRLGASVVEIVDDYTDYIKAFLCTDAHPLHLGNQSEAVRLAVPLGDTDSSLISIKLLGDWYYGECDFSVAQEPIQDVMTYLVTQVWEHMLAMFTAQMGVIEERRDKLIMKNEYKMPALQLTPVAKTYHAYVKAQEGLVFKSPEYERKGARFHGSKLNVDLIKRLHNLMDANLVKLSEGGKIDRSELVEAVYQIEQDILKSVHRKDNPYFVVEKVKPADEYANPNSSNFVHSPLWEMVFASRYGAHPPMPYQAAKIPVKLGNKTEINAWLETLPEDMKTNFNLWRTRYGKKADKFTNIKVPMEFLRNHEVPKELHNIIDFESMVLQLADPYRLLLDSMDIHLGKKLLSDFELHDE